MYDEALNELLDEFYTECQYGDFRSAAFSLAWVYFCLPNVDQKTQKTLRNTLETIKIPPQVLPTAKDEVAKLTQRIDQVVSVGSKWDIDEILLLLGLRIDVDVLLHFIWLYDESFDLNLTEIDAWFTWMPTSIEHRKLFVSAAGRIRNNWKVPIVSKWLGPVD